MREKRLLILGSLEDLVILTKLAVSRGIYTVVADGNDGEAKKYASKAYKVNLFDDELVDQIIREERIDHVLTSFSDILFELMVRISGRNGLPCFCKPDKMHYLRDKILMKEMFRELNIPYAAAQRITKNVIDEKEIHISFPCVVKPADGWGSKGLSVVHSLKELKEHLNDSMRLSTSGHEAMIETINMGYEINLMSWIKDGEVYLVEFGDRETSDMTVNSLPHQSREIFPSYFYKELEPVVKDYLLKIADYCNIEEGPLSMQFFYENGQISVGEVCGRFFGYGQGIVPVISGLDPNELLLNMVYTPDLNVEVLKKTRFAFDHCSIALYILPRHGIIRDMGNVMSFKNEHTVFFRTFVKPGVSTDYIPWIVWIYARFDTREEADQYTKDIYENLYVPDLNGCNLVISNSLVSYDGVKWKNMR